MERAGIREEMQIREKLHDALNKSSSNVCSGIEKCAENSLLFQFRILYVLHTLYTLRETAQLPAKKVGDGIESWNGLG